MVVTLYRSAFCPRCHLARKYLFNIISQKPEIQVEEVDVFASPVRTWREGIRMFPALKIDNHILSGVLLSKENIANFVAAAES
jgi:glutaredoxin